MRQDIVEAIVAPTRGLLPELLACGKGGTISVASQMAFQPMPYFASYAASKAFVLGFSEALAEELRGTAVRVTGVAPGFVSTEFTEVAGSAEAERRTRAEQGLSLTRGMADTEPGLRIHYVAVGAGPRVAVLLHGFPQTWYEWRRLIPPLVEAGFRVVAPDYRGAGHSWRPAGGYDKRTMAGDIRRLVREHLQIEDPVALVGHDIGLMVAYAYAQAYRNEVSHLAVVDAPLPGTAVFDRIRSDPRVWHFAFHGARDVPEMLVSGRERQYLQAFFSARIFNTAAISDHDLDIYVSAYSAPGAMRAGFELYRAFDQDADENREALEQNGKLTVPVLAAGGATSTTGPLVEEMMREVAETVTPLRVPRAAHWIPEENPGALSAALLDFLGAD